jgi:hypothetical protein
MVADGGHFLFYRYVQFSPVVSPRLNNNTTKQNIFSRLVGATKQQNDKTEVCFVV